MKYILILCSILGFSYVYAELPTPSADPKAKQTDEYIDSKIDKVQGYFSNSKSTATFSGWIDIGVEVVSPAACGTNVCTATCTVPKLVISGGCTGAGLTMDSSAPTAGRLGWRCAYNSGTTVAATAICARVK